MNFFAPRRRVILGVELAYLAIALSDFMSSCCCLWFLLFQNKKERKKVREVGILKKDPDTLKEQIEKLELMSKCWNLSISNSFCLQAC